MRLQIRPELLVPLLRFGPCLAAFSRSRLQKFDEGRLLAGAGEALYRLEQLLCLRLGVDLVA
jgi:hypothetical protein